MHNSSTIRWDIALFPSTSVSIIFGIPSIADPSIVQPPVYIHQLIYRVLQAPSTVEASTRKAEAASSPREIIFNDIGNRSQGTELYGGTNGVIDNIHAVYKRDFATTACY